MITFNKSVVLEKTLSGYIAIHSSNPPSFPFWILSLLDIISILKKTLTDFIYFSFFVLAIGKKIIWNAFSNKNAQPNSVAFTRALGHHSCIKSILFQFQFMLYSSIAFTGCFKIYLDIINHFVWIFLFVWFEKHRLKMTTSKTRNCISHYFENVVIS